MDRLQRLCVYVRVSDCTNTESMWVSKCTVGAAHGIIKTARFIRQSG